MFITITDSDLEGFPRNELVCTLRHIQLTLHLTVISEEDADAHKAEIFCQVGVASGIRNYALLTLESVSCSLALRTEHH